MQHIGATRSELWRIFGAASLWQPSPKQLQYWSQTGLLAPRFVHSRLPLYGFSDMVRAALAVVLDQEGLSLQASRRAIDYICREHLAADGLHLMVSTTEAKEARDLQEVLRALDGRTPWRWVYLQPEAVVVRLYEAAETILGAARLDWSELETFRIYRAS